jgi:hypothetical protein
MVLKDLEIAIIAKDNERKEEKRIRRLIRGLIIKLRLIIVSRKIKLKTK